MASKFFGVIGCGVTLGFAATTAIVAFDSFRDSVIEDPLGPIAGVIGCVALLAQPAGAATMALDIVGGIACIDALHATVNDFNKLSAAIATSNDSNIAAAEFVFENDLTQGVIGCALTGFSTYLDIGGYFE